MCFEWNICDMYLLSQNLLFLPKSVHVTDGNYLVIFVELNIRIYMPPSDRIIFGGHLMTSEKTRVENLDAGDVELSWVG